MQITSSYSVEIRKQGLCFRKTFEAYRSAAACLITVFDSVWEELEAAGNAKRRFNTAEHLVHSTKKNAARFDFDRRFPKMPSYLRRAAIQFALGAVSSYRTRLKAWETASRCEEGGRGSGPSGQGRPVLESRNHAMPVFYHDVMYKAGGTGSDQAKLKLFDGRDWVWREVRLKHTDMEYLRKHWCGKKASAPVLEKRYGKYFLRFTYTEEAKLPERPAGKVERSPENHSLCRFSTGKQYNCDLSASYNIGARYYIRELLKPLPETARSLLEAEVPAVKRRTSCVYADLLRLHAAMRVSCRKPGAA